MSPRFAPSTRRCARWSPRVPIRTRSRADRYDIVTIAAVANDVPTLKLALELGASAKNVTSRYDGTALIAAAHLGHAEIVRILSAAGAPLDHVNNLGWTALMESIVLGDGGARHAETLQVLLDAGADPNVPDRAGVTPLARRARPRLLGDGEAPGSAKGPLSVEPGEDPHVLDHAAAERRERVAASSTDTMRPWAWRSATCLTCEVTQA
jgi:hypothetical protein